MIHYIQSIMMVTSLIPVFLHILSYSFQLVNFTCECYFTHEFYSTHKYYFTHKYYLAYECYFLIATSVTVNSQKGILPFSAEIILFHDLIALHSVSLHLLFPSFSLL